jgi:hypothetical protein
VPETRDILTASFLRNGIQCRDGFAANGYAAYSQRILAGRRVYFNVNVISSATRTATGLPSFVPGLGDFGDRLYGTV